MMRARPKILIAGVGLELSGCGRFLADLTVGLHSLDWDVELFVARGGELHEDVARSGVKVTVADPRLDIRSGRSRLAAASAARLAETLRTARPDVLHTNLLGMDLVGRAVTLGGRVPVLMSTQHDAIPRPWPVSFVRRRTVAWTDATVACSDAVARYCRVEMRIPEDRLFIIENGVDVLRFEGVSRSPSGPRTILAMGPLTPPKGHGLLIDAFAHVAPVIPDARLVIAGDGPLRSQLETKVSRLRLEHRVEIRTATCDVVGLLEEADVFVQPSFSEGLSLALLEAMASGLPVIATDVSSHARVLDGGRCGAIVSPGQPKMLADAIVRLIENPSTAEALGRRARQRARQRYTLRRMVEEYGALYGRLLSVAGRGEAAKRA